MGLALSPSSCHPQPPPSLYHDLISTSPPSTTCFCFQRSLFVAIHSLESSSHPDFLLLRPKSFFAPLIHTPSSSRVINFKDLHGKRELISPGRLECSFPSFPLSIALPHLSPSTWPECIADMVPSTSNTVSPSHLHWNI